jgi:sterol desaturase/sphingolipid hydroxylase (fatty acid hydroxylase superfamily)
MEIEWFGILLAAALYMFIGYAWYSKWLFGKQWMKLSGITEEKMRKNKMAPVYGFINAIVLAFFLAISCSLLGATTVSDGMLVGGLAWLGFSMTTKISRVIWVGEPLALFFMEAGVTFISYVAMAGLLTA